MRGVWGRNRGRIPVESLDDSTREGRTTAAPLGPPYDWGFTSLTRRSSDLSAAGSLSSHLMTRHGKAPPRRHLWAPQTTGGPRTYKIKFPQGNRRQCPVEGCPGVSETRAAMRVHFVHWHVHDTVVILEEGNLSLPLCLINEYGIEGF